MLCGCVFEKKSDGTAEIGMPEDDAADGRPATERPNARLKIVIHLSTKTGIIRFQISFWIDLLQIPT